MTRKDYELIADTLATSINKSGMNAFNVSYFIADFSTILSKNNSKFQQSIFRERIKSQLDVTKV